MRPSLFGVNPGGQGGSVQKQVNATQVWLLALWGRVLLLEPSGGTWETALRTEANTPTGSRPRALEAPAWLWCVSLLQLQKGPEVGGWHPGYREVPLGEAAGWCRRRGWGLEVGEWARGAPPGVCSTQHLTCSFHAPPQAHGPWASPLDHGLQVTNSARLLLRWVFLNAHPVPSRAPC